jgi:hypothetical protein
VERIGPYEVVAKLGQGGMGSVYRVRGPHVAGRELALKHIVATPLSGPTALERFLREAQLLARVEHSGVVRIHACESIPGGAYLVQELIDGQDLKQVVQAGPLLPAEAARIVREVADAVAAVHRQGILHRDLKPANVVLRGEQPVLLDFGVARDLDAETLTKTGAMVGTPAYMSPEQAGGDAVGPETDVYGLGVILYELLLGRPPFEGSQFAVVKKVMLDEPVWPRAEREAVPAELEAVLRVAMAKEPSERYDTPEALREELDRFLNGRPTQAGGRPPPRARRRRPHAPLVAGGIAVAALALLGASSLGARLSQPVSTTPAPVVEVSEEPEPEPVNQDLWWLKPGDVFRARLVFDERAGSAQIRMDAVLACAVEQIEGGVASLAMTIEAISARFKVYTRVDDPDMLTPAEPSEDMSQILMRAVTRPFRAQLDLSTGEVPSMSGFEAIEAGLLAESSAIQAITDRVNTLLPAADSTNLAKTLAKIFSTRYLLPAMRTLTYVRDAQEGDEQGLWFAGPVVGGRRAFHMDRRGHESQLEYNVFTKGAARSKNALPVDLQGKASYEAGRLQSAEVTQRVDTENSSVTWSWVAVDPD